ncbi:hypothetical protein EIP91_007134 [Steccherinum ochraceum]|uniref:Uncharacterized protein n=1 Tax=Steccherinum ochraceum TaxID=92696 RepID=A0A4V2MVF8_9APHY|nr:hypothetical protein EIP91_007134 [Steccherinum ochraceum]
MHSSIRRAAAFNSEESQVACLEILSRKPRRFLGREDLTGHRNVSHFIRSKTGSPVRYKPLSSYIGTIAEKSKSHAPTPERILPVVQVVPAMEHTTTAGPPLSMSQRRIASKLPALNCTVKLPCAFPSLASNADLLGALSTPVTPLDQIMHTPSNPPNPCQSRDRTFKPKPKLSITTTIKAIPARQRDTDGLNSPYLPFTPLETPDCSPSPTSRLSKAFTKMNLSSNPGLSSSSLQPLVTQKPAATLNGSLAPRRIPLSLPRRLSYKSTFPTVASPLTPNMAASMLQPMNGSDLASPVTLKASFSVLPATPLTSDPPTVSSQPRSPSYF